MWVSITQQGSPFEAAFQIVWACKTAETGSELISIYFDVISFILHPHRQAHHRVSMTICTESRQARALVFLPCPENPGQAPEMIIYGEQSVESLRFSFQDQRPSLTTQALVWQKFHYSEEDGKDSDTDSSEAPVLILAKGALYLFDWIYYNQIKKSLQGIKILLDPFPQFTF